jgi:hypothetical protein
MTKPNVSVVHRDAIAETGDADYRSSLELLAETYPDCELLVGLDLEDGTLAFATTERDLVHDLGGLCGGQPFDLSVLAPSDVVERIRVMLEPLQFNPSLN